MRHVLRSDFGTFQLASGKHKFTPLAYLEDYISALLEDFGIAAILIALVGMAVFIISNPHSYGRTLVMFRSFGITCTYRRLHTYSVRLEIQYSNLKVSVIDQVVDSKRNLVEKIILKLFKVLSVLFNAKVIDFLFDLYNCSSATW